MKKFIKYIISLVFIFMIIPILSGCSSTPDFSGTYYSYDNIGYHKDKYFVIDGEKWRDDTGLQGDVTFTRNSQTNPTNYTTNYTVNGAQKYYGYAWDSGILMIYNSFGYYDYYCKEDAVLDKQILHELPIAITTKEQFLAIYNDNAQYLNCYDLLNDIDLDGTELFNGATKPREYRVRLNGRGHTIRNFEVKSTTYAGLFPSLTKSEVFDLKISDATIIGERSGGLAGYVQNSFISDITVSNTVKIGDGTHSFTGGIVGLATSSTIKSCKNSGTIKGTESTGGIAGKLYNSSMEECTNEGPVTGYGERNCGGVVGFFEQYWESMSSHTETFVKNSNIGLVTAKNTDNVAGVIGKVNRNKPGIRFADDSSILNIADCLNTGDIVGKNYVAGILGLQEAASGIDKPVKLNKCINKGSIYGYSYVAGVLAKGQANLTLDYCSNEYNEGKTNSVSGCYYVGGVAALANVLSNCENSGLVEFHKATEKMTNYDEQMFLGGIISDTLNSNNISLKNCKNTGIVRGYLNDEALVGTNNYQGWYVGGIAGLIGGGTFMNCENSGSIYASSHVGGLFGMVVPNYASTITECVVKGSLFVSGDGIGGGFFGSIEYTHKPISGGSKSYRAKFAIIDSSIDMNVEALAGGKFGYCAGRAFSNSSSSNQYGNASIRDCSIKMNIKLDSTKTINAVCENSVLSDKKVLLIDLAESDVNVSVTTA